MRFMSFLFSFVMLVRDFYTDDFVYSVKTPGVVRVPRRQHLAFEVRLSNGERRILKAGSNPFVW